jgi:Na+-transporting NADH:ubiquinone oxidoreductase subunit B
MKRLMIIVVLALLPPTLFGMYNTGYQSAKALGILEALTPWQLFVNGGAVVLPIIVVSYLVGGIWELLFAIVRKHPISEGFLVTGLLFPLTLPPTIPLWQVAVGISFGVVIGKEIFGGTGMNVLNPALTGRVFLFFSFPASISGDKVSIMHDAHRLIYGGAGAGDVIDGFTGATTLLTAALAPTGSNIIDELSKAGFHDFSLMNLFLGFIPGSIGETSTLAILIGAIIMLITGVASWEIIASVFAGGFVGAAFLNLVATPALPPMLSLPPLHHFFIGGFALGAVYMATDPVSAAQTKSGKYIYGFLIGIFTVMIRVWNPAYPEGMMLSILLMNVFAPLIDYFVLKRNIARRLRRATAE